MYFGVVSCRSRGQPPVYFTLALRTRNFCPSLDLAPMLVLRVWQLQRADFCSSD